MKKCYWFVLIAILIVGVILTFLVFSSDSKQLSYLYDVTEKSLFRPGSSQELFQDVAQPEVAFSQSFLDGTVQIDNQKRAIAVMIENHPQARPQQSGLSSARVVYEAVAEGGITRFLALFGWDDIAVIGPVRSARPYFVSWAEEFKAVYAHAGGSDQAFTTLWRSDVLDVDGLYYEEISDSFWRDRDFKAPHNLFSSVQSIREIAQKRDFDLSMSSPRFDFGDVPETAFGRSFRSVSLNFSFPEYQILYEYDRDRAVFKRFMDDHLHADSYGLIEPSNVIVLFAKQYSYDHEGRMYVQTSGTGKAYLFRDGHVYQGVWEKSPQFTTTQFYFLSGDKFVLKPGKIWIEVLKDESQMKINES